MHVSVAFAGNDKPLDATLMAQKHHTTVGDMGRSYGVTSDKLYVLVPNEYGAAAKVFLDETMGVLVHST